jgi:hypothetical protein
LVPLVTAQNRKSLRTRVKFTGLFPVRTPSQAIGFRIYFTGVSRLKRRGTLGNDEKEEREQHQNEEYRAVTNGQAGRALPQLKRIWAHARATEFAKDPP